VQTARAAGQGGESTARPAPVDILGAERDAMDLLPARAVMVLHLGFLAYVVGGGVLLRWWPRTVFLHLAAVGWGVTSVLIPLRCPLTALEDTLRARAGAPSLGPGGFIDHYLENVVYPERYTPLVRAVVAGIVVASWVGLARSGGLRRRPSGAGSRCRSEGPGTGAGR
jgi:hypothetical protein